MDSLASTCTPVKLRPYQSAAIETMRAHIRRGRRRLVLVAPTGSGKTSIASEMIRSAVNLERRILFLAHRRELLDQCHQRLAQSGVTSSIVRADDPRIDLTNPVQVASVQTIVRRLEKDFTRADFDLIVIDECHHVRASTYGRILDYFSTAGAIIGLTATPCRKDGRGLAETFDELVQASSIPELISLGFLVPIRMFTAPAIDLSDLRTARGDYAVGELGQRMDSHTLVGNIVDEWQRLASDRPTVVFGTTVRHSESIAERFRDLGVRAEHLDGQTPAEEREKILHRVKRGQTQVVVNCQILTEGWDMPAVSCCVLARPTKSLALYLQMAGRVLRPAPGKSDCLILDHGNNFIEHGRVDAVRRWSLTGDTPAQPGDVPSKRCANCGLVVAAGVRSCPECGFIFATPTQQHLEVSVRLVEATEQSALAKRSEFFRIVDEVRQLRRHDGTPYKLTAAVVRFREQFFEWPKRSWQREAGIR